MLVQVVVKYDGSHYNGWQSQNGCSENNTIANTINKVVSALNKEKTEIVASGRTDAKVHALGQSFHFENKFNIPLKRLKNTLNHRLPDDIEVVSIKNVDDDFHARFSAKSKEYHYYLNMGAYDLFKKDYITQLNKPLDVKLMQEAAKLFEGRHNFTAFNTTPRVVKENQYRTIYKCEIILENDILIFKIVGNSFLRHMVRMMVGMLVYIGLHKRDILDLKYLLETNLDIRAPYNMEPNGLYLYKVNY